MSPAQLPGLPPLAVEAERATLPNGQEVEVRGLTRREVLATAEDGLAGRPELAGLERAAAYEVYVLACGTDTPIEAARAWYEAAPSAYVDPVVTAITNLSGLGDVGKASGGDS